jgi:uncharacterized OsmC-like protein
VSEAVPFSADAPRSRDADQFHDITTLFSILSFLYTLLTAHAMAFSPQQSLWISTRLTFALSVRRERAVWKNRGAAPRTTALGSSGPTNVSCFATNTSTPDHDDEKRFIIKSYTIHGVGKGSRVEVRTNTGHELVTDVPAQTTMGGTDSAPQPVETLLAALLGCTQATAIFVGRHLKPRILIERLEFVDIVAERDERGALSLPIDVDPSVPARLQKITGTIQVYTRRTQTKKKKEEAPPPLALSQEQLDMLSRQTELRCPVANMMMASGCEMNIQWIDGSSTTGSSSKE